MSKLHLVFGGRVKDPQALEFADLGSIDLVGIYDSFAAAEEAWEIGEVVTAPVLRLRG